MRSNRYARKLQHKHKLKRKHAVRYSVYDVGADERKARDEYWQSCLTAGRVYRRRLDHRNGGYKYWEDFSLSGPRAYAKYCTNRRIRSKYRNLASRADQDHIQAMRGSQYEKEYDYAYTVW